ncbi:tyrosine-type recombinase/integrase [Paenibacillus pinihumi]|uniref:tyrosine-type recombinase/integrase n=1 Tax=Paenibacillus pinihumi TaxID=669462 RepID=UPI000417E8F2|nr:tyrosine-type recombinase/integrase [Paenibacillus pinihumi]
MSGYDPRKGRSIVRGKSRAGSAAGRKIDYTLSEVFSIFYEAKKAERVRDRTLEDYVINWGYFTEWLREDMLASELTPERIRKYINYMSTKKKYSEVKDRKKTEETLSTQTLISRLSTLRTLFNWLAANNYLEPNPMSGIKMPKKDEVEKATYTDDNFLQLLKAPDEETYAGYRDKVLMMTLGDGGFRIHELLLLMTEYLDVKGRCIYLPASMNKNRKPRWVPLSADTIRNLVNLINETKQYFDTAYIFVSNYGEPLKADNFRKRLKKYAKIAGVDPGIVFPHQFRSYFCTSYLLNGGDPFTLRKIVAHSRIETTQRYVRMNQDNIRDQHTKFSPVQRAARIKRKKSDWD